MMLHPQGRLGIVWDELKKRKVFQVALVYLLMSWGVMQVGELLFEALQVPDGAYTLLVILVLLGFPVAVVLAWAYEITPQGIRRDIVEELRQAQMLDTSYAFARQKGERILARIAILPLRDMAPGHDLSHFCDGLAEEIQNALCKAPGIEVIARAHSFQYDGKKLNFQKLERELGANAIIEGSVRSCDGTFRISIQLVDAATSTDLWSRSHEVSLQNEFAIQKHVAAEVARHTCLTFSEEERGSTEACQMEFTQF